jgi:hypothetical protein
MPKKPRSFTAETKVAVIKRMLCGEESGDLPGS